MERAPVEQFEALSAIPGIVHAFTLRVPGLDVKVDRELALQRLDQHHAAARKTLGLSQKTFVYATQVHGACVTTVDKNSALPVPAADGLVSNDPEVCLGIYVADCCAVFLVDPKRRVLALLHSGKKGTEQSISAVAVEKMQSEFGCNPADIVAQLSPCIRPPHYDVDFSGQIVGQLQAAGVSQVHDSGACTACDIERYYSYRLEMGKTGRMLAMLAFRT